MSTHTGGSTPIEALVVTADNFNRAESGHVFRQRG